MGVGGIDPRQEASCALGEQGIAVMVSTLAAAIRRILEPEGQEQ